MAKEDLDALLERMEAIAKAVNSFTSEAVQHEAFSALVTAFEGKRHPVKVAHSSVVEPEAYEPEDVADQPAAGGNGSKPTRANKQRKPSKASATEWKMVKDLDLHPVGKQSFDEYITEKQPASNEDKYAVIVYYLTDILEIPAVTIDQVGTVFRLTKAWSEPTSVASGLRTTSSRKGTLDMKNYNDIKITPTGRNFVEHSLPSKTKGAK